MATNVSQKDQKDKLFVLNKQAFLEELLNAHPLDYQERNWFYHLVSIFLSYPLQLISILAGSYLLYDIAKFVWQLDNSSINASFIYVGCILIFIGIETLRRWLVNTTGYHYMATFKVKDQKLIQGEWLRVKMYWLLLISVLLITSGTYGTYIYIKQNSPKADVLSMEVATSPIESKIKDEKTAITQIDQHIAQLMQSKKSELKDFKNYQVWDGREYLLPEAKKRHENYDKQIADMQKQRETHQNLVLQYEQRLSKKEQATESENAKITTLHQINKEVYAGISAGIWLCFEILLVFMLSYTWMFRYGVKREKLLEMIDLKKKANTNMIFENNSITALQPSYMLPHTEYQHLLGKQSLNFQKIDLNAKAKTITQEKQIGFEKWYEKGKNVKKEVENLDLQAKAQKNKILEPENELKSNTNIDSKEIVKEVIIKEVPVIQEVIIEREVPIEVIHREIENGYAVKCAHCGKEEIKKRPAKFCSSACRNKSWKSSN